MWGWSQVPWSLDLGEVERGGVKRWIERIAHKKAASDSTKTSDLKIWVKVHKLLNSNIYNTTQEHFLAIPI